MNGLSSDFLTPVRSDSQRATALAVAGVLLALTVLVAFIRMSDVWSDEAFFVISLATFVLLFGLAFLLKSGGSTPSPTQSALLVAGLLMALLALNSLADLTTDDPGSGTGFWVAGVFTLIALKAAYLYRSSVCTLITALAFGVTVLYFIDWSFDPTDRDAFRWVTLGLILFYALVARNLRDSAPKHSRQLVNTMAVATLGLAGMVGFDRAASIFPEDSIIGAGGEGTLLGWKIALGILILGLLIYAIVRRERGPAFLAGINLLAFAIVVAPSRPSVSGMFELEEPTLMGWPLILAIVTALAFLLALRPKDSNESSSGLPPDTVISSEESGI